MASRAAAGIRRVMFQLHLWLSLVLFLPLVPLGLTGSALAWPEVLNAVTNPAPKAGIAGAALLSPSAYLEAARQAAPGSRIQSLQMPTEADAPVRVVVNNGRSGPAGSDTVWLEPGTARVLKVATTTSMLFAISHDLHGHFMISGIGRKLVGYAGVILLVISLTGLWLWWPRGSFAKGLQWRRTPDGFMNLHHMVGFWISIPLAVVALTGIFITFPPLTTALFGIGGGAVQPARQETAGRRAGPPQLSADEAVLKALADRPDAQLSALTMPGAGGRGAAANPPGRWRVELKGRDGARTLAVDDASGAVTELPRPAPPTATPQRQMRSIHAGDGSLVWRWLVTLTGLLPLILAVTGVYYWAKLELRKARARRLQPAAASA